MLNLIDNKTLQKIKGYFELNLHDLKMNKTETCGIQIFLMQMNRREKTQNLK